MHEVMSAEPENKIFEYLLEIGCCKHCCLRYLNIRNEDLYLNVNEFMAKRGLLVNDENGYEHAKKCKSNPCIVCLGLLQDFVIDNILQSPQLDEAGKYDSSNFTCSVSMPVNILLREHLIKIDLRKKFPIFFKEDFNETQLNKAWKLVIKNKLADKLNKTFENSDTCDFSVNITLNYDDESKELGVLKKIAPDHFKNRTEQRRKYSGEMYTRKDVLNLLNKINEDQLLKGCSVPPEISTNWLICKSIDCKHNPIYFAGRYCKYSRELSQSPWIIDGVKTMETSVQELIFEEIHKMFNVPLQNLKFSASGREDCDVRCLGRGRPFYVEINDPKVTQFSSEVFRELEKQINASTLIEIRDLQRTQKNELSCIKEGEESKTKTYVALCKAEGPVSEEQLEIINKAAPLEILQKTPIRVLHRRPLAVRTKIIHEMIAKRISEKNDIFQLDVITQAGTYVKEFVHGDFDRTLPNIGTLINMEVDIIALDVVAINLDWPKPIEYELS